MNKTSILSISLALLPALGAVRGFAQEGGDQIIDGIGETALVTRHVFRGNEQDASRNAQHGSLQGEGGSYVRDEKFGRVLSLPGGNGAYAQIPGLVLDGLDTISVSGWFLPGTNQPGGLFSFGVNAASNFFCVPIEGEAGGYRAGITAGDSGTYGFVLPELPTNRWVHVAIVLDAANRALIGYVDGVKAGQVTNVNLTMGAGGESGGREF